LITTHFIYRTLGGQYDIIELVDLSAASADERRELIGDLAECGLYLGQIPASLAAPDGRLFLFHTLEDVENYLNERCRSHP
jgi:hypothetical protein